MTTQITRLITNQLIIGKTETHTNDILITDPYEIIPTAEGIQMLPFDEHILGVKIEHLEVLNTNILYSKECSAELRNTYLSGLTGLELSNNQLII